MAVACIALAVGSLALQNSPDFDPWGWIVWGREVLHLDLSTTSGPSWKPGAVVFTTIFALSGGLAPSFWMLTARLGALLAVVMAYRVPARLAGWFAGFVAAVLVLVMHDFVHGAIYGEAEPLMVGFLLFGIDRALARSERAALILLLFASLLRPEVWPVLGAYSVYLWTKSAARRPWIIVVWGLLALLWFGGDWWGSANPLSASTRAKQFVIFNPYEHYARPGVAMLTLAGDLLHRPSILLAGVAVVFAIRRRDAVVLALAASAVTMLLAVVAMAQDGYPVLDRFLFGSVSLTLVLSGIGAGYVVRLIWQRQRIAALAVAALIVALLSPLVTSNVRSWRPDIESARQWSNETQTVRQAIAAAGMARIVACRGSIATYVLLAPTLAWDLDTHMTRVFSWGDNPNGIIFIRDRDPLQIIESQKPRSIHTIAQAAGWRVLYVVTRLPKRKTVDPIRTC